MTAPLHLLGGIINIPLWQYRCVLTIAQIELLTADCPVTQYNKKKGEKGRPSNKAIEKANNEWAEREKERMGNPITLDLSELVAFSSEQKDNNIK